MVKTYFFPIFPLNIILFKHFKTFFFVLLCSLFTTDMQNALKHAWHNIMSSVYIYFFNKNKYIASPRHWCRYLVTIFGWSFDFILMDFSVNVTFIPKYSFVSYQCCRCTLIILLNFLPAFVHEAVNRHPPERFTTEPDMLLLSTLRSTHINPISRHSFSECWHSPHIWAFPRAFSLLP